MIRFLSCGESALTIEVGEVIDEKINAKVIALSNFIKAKNIKGIREIVPTYRSVTIFYDPIVFNLESFIELTKKNIDSISIDNCGSRKIIEIPVIYGGEYGPDLERVCTHNNLSKEEVINIHGKNEYLVYMIGFTPGFPYLGGMDKALSTPRLEAPRKKIWKGSVGIAGDQTGIYPLESPGGWNIIGRTPLSLFDMNSEDKSLIKAGDYVKFVPINENQYLDLARSHNQR